MLLSATQLSQTPIDCRTLAYAKPALEDHLGNRHKEKDAADNGIQAKESHVNPLQASASGYPVFHHQAGNDNEPARQVSDSETTQQPEQQQKTAHKHVGQKRCFQGILGTPSDNQGV